MKAWYRKIYYGIKFNYQNKMLDLRSVGIYSGIEFNWQILELVKGQVKISGKVECYIGKNFTFGSWDSSIFLAHWEHGNVAKGFPATHFS